MAQILRLPGVIAKSGLARSTLYKMVAAKLWTKPIRLSARAVGWPGHEIDRLIGARVAGRSDREIRDLVIALEAARRDADAAA